VVADGRQVHAGLEPAAHHHWLCRVGALAHDVRAATDVTGVIHGDGLDVVQLGHLLSVGLAMFTRGTEDLDAIDRADAPQRRDV